MSNNGNSEHHVISVGFYSLIGATLLVFTGITYFAATVNLGPANIIVALAIATFKATLVVLFFMHVKYTSEKMTRATIVSAIFFLMLLLALSMADFATRSWT
jgi:cytochrome c oxidase subunit IV